MDPTTPAPDEFERPAESEATASDAEAVAEGGPPAGSAQGHAGTDTWRGPEAAGRTPASIEPAPTGEAASLSEPVSAGESAQSTEAAQSGGGTSGWRGPEAAGRTPASIEPSSAAAPAPSAESTSAPEAAPAADSAPIDESAPTAESAESSGETSAWRGPEATGWTPEATHLAPPAQQPAQPTHEWPAADRAPSSPDNVDRSGDADSDGEPARPERVPAAFSFFSRARSDGASDEDAASAAEYAPSEHLRVTERPRRLPGRRAAPETLVRADPAEICPFLMAASGGWRLAVPSREHRCGAVNPPSPLSPQKQTRLCLTEGHLRCATFLAAGAARESRVGSAAMPDRVSRWALARTTPVVDEVGGVRATLAGMLADRRRWPAIPAMLLVVALATLGLSSLRGGGAGAALATPTPEPTEVARATASLAPTPTLAPTPQPSPSVAPTEAATAAPTPAPSHATYTVQSGDTLGAIARQFGTTVQALVDLNGLTDPGRLKIGQVLLIP